MVQKDAKGRIGRPRSYDPKVALQRAMEAFWDVGFAATSLDDLSARTGMNRPSLYAAFGDKQALYLKTLDAYRAGRRAELAVALEAGLPIEDTLRAMHSVMIDRFLQGERGARGCYLVGTAATEAVSNPRVRKALLDAVSEMEDVFRDLFSAAKARGELPPDADPKALAVFEAAVADALAFRARAGQSRAALRTLADSAVRLICGGSKKGPRRLSRARPSKQSRVARKT
jgi:AcrR family transcriptional regulator